MTGVWRLIRLYVRTSWPLLAGPALLLAALVVATARGVKGLYPSAEDRAVYAATMGASPAGWAFNGRGVDLHTIGGIAAYEVGFMGQLVIPVVGLLLGVGLTRRLEEAGVIELVTSGRVARTAVPWGTWVWWPALSFLGLEAIAVVASVAIAARRDLGSGVLPQRLGPGTASAALGTPAGLAWRLTRGTTFAWASGAVIWCASIGLMADEMARIIRQNPTLAEALGDDPGQVVSVMSLVITGIVAGAAGVAATSRFGAEEQAARMGLALAGAVSRVRMWLVWSGVAIASALATLFAGALALGVAQLLSGGTRSVVGRELRAAGAYTAPVVLVTVAAGLLVALSPRLRGLAWLPLGWFAVVGLMAEALRLPQWSRNLSPYELVGRVPLESLDRTAWAWLAVASVGAISAAAVRFATRSLARG